MNGLESRMNDEQKAAMDEGYDMITELMEFIRDRVGTNVPESREILNDARGVLDLMNEVIYKTL
tara:strand:+ start:418 stop:609 length:192 start_codon:yes stop_codon:yes gene_type:complete